MHGTGVLPLLSATIPNACPFCWPTHMQTPEGNDYLAFWPCNNCPSCRQRIAAMDVQKLHDGLPRSAFWQLLTLDKTDPDFAYKQRWILDRLNANGMHFTTSEESAVRHFLHEPIHVPWLTVQTPLLNRKRALIAMSALIRSERSLAVRHSRASKSRPCWPKTSAERRRDFDKRQPHEKHKRVVTSPLGHQRFQQLAIDRIGRKLNSMDRLSRSDVDALFVLNRPFNHSKSAVFTANTEARLTMPDRDERRMERLSWHASGLE